MVEHNLSQTMPTKIPNNRKLILFVKMCAYKETLHDSIEVMFVENYRSTLLLLE